MKSVNMSIVSAYSGDIPADIYEIIFDVSGLKVRVSPEIDGPAALFSDSIGFRYLDEGDLLEFWSADEYEPNGWIYEVKTGGWLELESNRSGFLSYDRKGLKEYFVATSNGCLSVLAFRAPELSIRVT